MTENATLAERTAVRQSLWTVIDALGVRSTVSPTDAMVDAVLEVQYAELALTEALVVGVLVTNAAEQQMTQAVDTGPSVPPPVAENDELPAPPATGLDAVVGEVVHTVLMSADDEELMLVTGTGTLYVPVTGSCCSSSWWNDIINIKQLIGARVTGHESIDIPDVPADQARQEDIDYGLKITTDRGACTLVYRNSSNGYYGGSHHATWYPAGVAVPLHNKDLSTYRSLTEDYSA